MHLIYLLIVSLLFLIVNINGYHPFNKSIVNGSLKKSEQCPENIKSVTDERWTIGVYTGTSPFALSSPAGLKNPVLTSADVNDLNVDIVAHPFMIVTDSMYYMFFTAKDERTDKGGIGLAESKNGLEWKYKKIVIQEPYVLAYPYVFKWKNDYYMIPEAHTETSVSIYKAVEFPEKWENIGKILTGDKFFVPSIINYENMWWMFTVRPGNETLRLFYADSPMGPWIEHLQSPIVEKDLNIARPAGRPFIYNGELYRLGMDCYPTYGLQVYAFKVTEISTKKYKEEFISTPLLKASSGGWNEKAMHHIDVQQVSGGKWLAVVDALGN